MTVPSLVQNAFTTAVRARLGAQSSSWNALTDAQRATWVNASGFTGVDRFGRSFSLKGKQLFVQLNSILINAGQAPITTAPLPSSVASVTEFALTSDIGTSKIQLVSDLADVPAGTEMVVFATAPQSAGTASPSKGKYRQIATVAAATSFPYNSYTKYIAKFGIPAIGSKMFFKVKLISASTGQASPESAASVTTA